MSFPNKVELTSGKWRSTTQHWFGEFFWQIGIPSLAAAVYFIPDMKTFELIIIFITSPILLLWFIIPESPRWLLAKGRTDEAKNILAKACKINNKPLSNLALIDKNMSKEKVNSTFYTRI